MEINFKEFFDYLIKRWWIILIATMLGFIITFLSSAFLVEKKYQCRIVFAYEDNYEKYELSTDKKYVERSVSVLKENVYLKKLETYLAEENSPADTVKPEHEKLTQLYTVEDLKKAIITDYNSLTLSMEFRIITTDSKDSLLIAQAIANKSMLQHLSEIIGIGTNNYSRFKEVAYPELDAKAISPNTTLNSFLGLLLGFMAGILVCILIEKLDVRVKGERDLIEKYDLPILGMIPTFLPADEVK